MIFNYMEEVKRQKCEVYSRIVGYLRPVEQWNDGKQEEFKMRKIAHLNNVQGSSNLAGR